MWIPDANVLIYATDRTAPRHQACHAWLSNALGGSVPVGFAWSVLLAVVRLTTKCQLFTAPLSVEGALDVVDQWLSQPAAVVVAPGAKHASALRTLLAPLGAGGNLVTDAHLAALAVEHGATVVSCDNDFGRFERLQWLDPTQARSF